MKQNILKYFSSFALTVLLGVLGGCAERAGTGAFMQTPNVGIACSTARCKANITARAYVTYTTSSCLNPQFGETAAGSAILTCNALGCTGTASNFTTPTMREGFYSVCVIVDFNSNYVGSAIPGEDSTGLISNINLVGGILTTSVTSFTDI